MSPSYIALPTITPSTFLSVLAFLISSIDDTPPEITTGQLEISATFNVSSIDDIKKTKAFKNKKIEGIIVGKAIYDGDIKLDELAKELNA